MEQIGRTARGSSGRLRGPSWGRGGLLLPLVGVVRRGRGQGFGGIEVGQAGGAALPWPGANPPRGAERVSGSGGVPAPVNGLVPGPALARRVGRQADTNQPGPGPPGLDLPPATSCHDAPPSLGQALRLGGHPLARGCCRPPLAASTAAQEGRQAVGPASRSSSRPEANRRGSRARVGAPRAGGGRHSSSS